jgi:hypothetical protein
MKKELTAARRQALEHSLLLSKEPNSEAATEIDYEQKANEIAGLSLINHTVISPCSACDCLPAEWTYP